MLKIHLASTKISVNFINKKEVETVKIYMKANLSQNVFDFVLRINYDILTF